MSLGFGQIAILLIIILILFGAGKLPRVMKDLAKGMKAFKEGLNDEENSEKESPHIAEAKPTATVISTPHTKTTARKKAS